MLPSCSRWKESKDSILHIRLKSCGRCYSLIILMLCKIYRLNQPNSHILKAWFYQSYFMCHFLKFSFKSVYFIFLIFFLDPPSASTLIFIISVKSGGIRTMHMIMNFCTIDEPIILISTLLEYIIH